VRIRRDRLRRSVRRFSVHTGLQKPRRSHDSTWFSQQGGLPNVCRVGTEGYRISGNLCYSGLSVTCRCHVATSCTTPGQQIHVAQSIYKWPTPSSAAESSCRALWLETCRDRAVDAWQACTLDIRSGFWFASCMHMRQYVAILHTYN
jgi:hypothetical protein